MRRILATGGALGLLGALCGLLLTAAPGSAYIQGGCTGTATDVNGKANPTTINIVNTDHWNVSKDSNISGEGNAPSDQTHGSAAAVAFGIGFIPIASGQGHGTKGSGNLDVSKYSAFARVFAVAGSSDSCSGYLVIEVVDESALETVAGKAGIGALALGVLGLLAVAFRRLPVPV